MNATTYGVRSACGIALRPKNRSITRYDGDGGAERDTHTQACIAQDSGGSAATQWISTCHDFHSSVPRSARWAPSFEARQLPRAAIFQPDRGHRPVRPVSMAGFAGHAAMPSGTTGERSAPRSHPTIHFSTTLSSRAEKRLHSRMPPFRRDRSIVCCRAVEGSPLARHSRARAQAITSRHSTHICMGTA